MDYTTLTAAKGTAGSIADYLNNSTVAASVPFFIEEAESFIYRTLRHWRMLTNTTGTMSVGSDRISIPSDFLDPYQLVLISSPTLPGYGPQLIPLVTPEMVVSQYSYDGDGNRNQGIPCRYYFGGSNLQLDTPPDQGYSYQLTYYAQPTALSADNPSNWLTTYYPRLLRATVMAHAVEWSKESGSGNYDRTYWMTIAAAELSKAQQESDFSKRSAALPMVSQAYTGAVF